MIDPHEGGARLPIFAKHGEDERFLASLNSYLAEFKGPESSSNAAEQPIIYIVGAPRSGTTLLSQLVSRYLPVGYINNLIARFWLKPSVGIRLSSIVLGDNARRSIDFKSRHGVTDEIAGPHEFGYFWAHWFKLDKAQTHHLSKPELAAIDHAGLRFALAREILAPFNAPVVFKNVICGFQAPLLSHLHPKSLFIHITREPRDTAASILKSRLERYGSYDTWWSLKPSSFSSFPLDPVEQVVRQVADCRRELDEKINASGAPVLRISYESMCREPARLLEEVCEKARLLGWSMEPLAKVPPFVPSGCPLISAELLVKLEAAMRRGD